MDSSDNRNVVEMLDEKNFLGPSDTATFLRLVLGRHALIVSFA